MKNTKRIVSWRTATAAIAFPLVGVLAMSGCSSDSGASNSGSTNGVTTLTFATQTYEKENPYEAVAKKFEASHPNIKINMVTTPIDQYANVLKTQLTGGNAPDVFFGASGSGGSNALLGYADAGFLMDLTDLEWANKQVPDNAKGLFYKDDKQFALPVSIAPIVMITNETAAKAAGITLPKTTDDLMKVCETRAAAGKSTVALPGSVPGGAGLFLMEIAASTVYSEESDWNQKRADNKTTFAGTQGWKDALQQVVDMNKAKCFQPGAEGGTFDQLAPLISSGDALMTSAPANQLSNLQKAATGQTITVSTIPGESEDKTRLFASPSDALAVNAATKNKDAALEFLKYWTDTQVATEFAETRGDAPISIVTTGEVPEKLAPIAPLLKDQEKYLPLANLSWPNPEVYTALGSGVQGLLTGQTTVDQVLAAADAAWSN
ncbi:extracellular solute-binding protein [Paenarthrobacter sp. TYUT067]|uniref:ABC transporter substrate-binding protein n=1 Tax=Paenarthrobacter sp. TYUT067 TaxID=2926245 RepID=UPI00202E7179|nr:extracellular solute-binding protein [Paenarthrobacter sp. TYUT067]MCM0616826.1 extracellular solute-binding protein [Paenarthrobacter sp. TYUT067]